MANKSIEPDGSDQRRFGGVTIGAVLLALSVAACRVDDGGHTSSSGPSLVEMVGAEVGNLEVEVRALRRQRDRLRNDREALTKEVKQEEDERRALLAKQQDQRVALQTELRSLQFLEDSVLAAHKRAKVVEQQIAKLRALEKEKAGLPQQIQALEAALAGPRDKAKELLEKLRARVSDKEGR